MTREQFNHDWLKNQYIPALESFRNILTGQVQRLNPDQDFWYVEFPEWETHRTEAARLISGFEESMSPRIFFDEIPLSGCDTETKNWMGLLITKLWSARLSVPELTERAADCLKTANEAYEKLNAGLETNLHSKENDALAQSFEEFRNACHALARAFERFPNRVRVV